MFVHWIVDWIVGKLLARRAKLPALEAPCNEWSGVEELEGRRFFSYTIPPGHTIAFAQRGQTDGWVVLRLDDPITGTIGTTFTNTTGIDEIDAGTNSGFKLVDQVPG